MCFEIMFSLHHYGLLCRFMAEMYFFIFNMELPLKIVNIGTMLLVISESDSVPYEAKSVGKLGLLNTESESILIYMSVMSVYFQQV